MFAIDTLEQNNRCWNGCYGGQKLPPISFVVSEIVHFGALCALLCLCLLFYFYFLRGRENFK